MCLEQANMRLCARLVFIDCLEIRNLAKCCLCTVTIMHVWENLC